MPDVDIDFYCRAYDDFLSPADCEAYIDKYEETLRVDNERWKELSTCIMKDGSKNPTCGNCSCDRLGPMEFDRFRELNDRLIHKWQDAVERYVKDCQIKAVQWPKTIGWDKIGKRQQTLSHLFWIWFWTTFLLQKLKAETHKC